MNAHRTAPRPQSSPALLPSEAPVEMVGVWDTVKALGLRLPFFWMFRARISTGFTTITSGPPIRHGFHALALNETRERLCAGPVGCPPGWQATSSRSGFAAPMAMSADRSAALRRRGPLANIPLVWMLDRAEAWAWPAPKAGAPASPRPRGPMVGTWRSWGKAFLLRRRRVVGATGPSGASDGGGVGCRAVGRGCPPNRPSGLLNASALRGCGGGKPPLRRLQA